MVTVVTAGSIFRHNNIQKEEGITFSSDLFNPEKIFPRSPPAALFFFLLSLAREGVMCLLLNHWQVKKISMIDRHKLMLTPELGMRSHLSKSYGRERVTEQKQGSIMKEERKNGYWGG